jgi:hypothetical protein
MSAIPEPTAFTLASAIPDEQPMLSGLEWKVVALALRETDTCCGTDDAPSRLAHLLRRIGRALTGWEGPLPLANPRLETLRRFVCMLRRGHRDAATTAQSLVRLGFSPRQLHAVAARVRR